ncbi:hypothetical protein CBM2592_B40110 [Cupriavidus taiwanensis]|nr:hypothetical protein CBM2592_B40110 [Cupriavidus taiwanensis]SPA20952.1 hypothetical protein CBM2631_B50064 [Cupriavidus taiwanensis]
MPTVGRSKQRELIVGGSGPVAAESYIRHKTLFILIFQWVRRQFS